MELNYGDSEFALSGNDKIDFKTIIFKQIDYIRFLRTQDFGEFTVMNMQAIPNQEELFLKWFGRISMYQNSVLSLKNLLRNYIDDKYNNNIKEINTKYKNLLLEQRKILVINAKKIKMLDRNYQEQLTTIERKFSFVHVPKKYDDIFQELIQLSERAKFIGGNDTLRENN